LRAGSTAIPKIVDRIWYSEIARAIPVILVIGQPMTIMIGTVTQTVIDGIEMTLATTV
jgi:hypothetical protein